jgi:hypothetical protein
MHADTPCQHHAVEKVHEAEGLQAVVNTTHIQSSTHQLPGSQATERVPQGVDQQGVSRLILLSAPVEDVERLQPLSRCASRMADKHRQ